MSMSANCLMNSLVVRAHGKPFYASDLGLNGGEINGLSINRYIKATGNTKTVMVPIDTWHGDRIFKECKVKEWEYCGDAYGEGWLAEMQERELRKMIIKAQKILELAAQLGIGAF